MPCEGGFPYLSTMDKSQLRAASNAATAWGEGGNAETSAIPDKPTWQKLEGFKHQFHRQKTTFAVCKCF